MESTNNKVLDCEINVATCDHNATTFRVITWKELKQGFGIGITAKGCVLKGLVIFREEEFWKAGICKVFRVQDSSSSEVNPMEWEVSLVQEKKDERKEGSSSGPLFSVEEENAIEFGAVVAFFNPRLHIFVDREEGLSIDNPKEMKVLQKAKDVKLYPETKLKIAESLKAKGNKWMSKMENHRAVGNYNAAISLAEKIIEDLSEISKINNDGAKSTNLNDDYIASARMLQSACGCNLMLIAIQGGEWRAAIGIGEKVLNNGAKNDICCKVLYRMGLAFEKLGSMEMALNYAQRARNLFFPEARDKSIEKLIQRVSSAITGQRRMKGLEEEHSRLYSLPGMNRKFGYRAPFLLEPSTVEKAQQVVLDLSCYYTERSTVPLLPNSGEPGLTSVLKMEREKTRESGIAKVKPQQLKPHILYLCTSEFAHAAEKECIRSMYRFKTVIYYHISPLTPSVSEISLFSSSFFFFPLRSIFSWRRIKRCGHCSPPIPSENCLSLLDGASIWIKAPSGYCDSSTLLPLPNDKPVIVSVDVAPYLFPSFLLLIFAFLVFIGWYSWVQWLQGIYFRWTGGPGSLPFQKRLEDCLREEREGREGRKGLLGITASILSEPVNYPIAFCEECPPGHVVDERSKGDQGKRKKIVEKVQEKSIFLPIFNNFMSLLLQEQRRKKEGDDCCTKDMTIKEQKNAPEGAEKRQNVLNAQRNIHELQINMMKASTFLFNDKEKKA